jgi:MFS family permease
MVAGGIAVLASGLLLTTLTPSTSVAFLFLAYAVFGVGSGLVNPPITNTAVSGMPPAQAGVASAVATTSRQVGIALGVAVLGAVAGGGLAGALGPGFAEAMRPAWWIVAVLGLIVAVLGYLSTTGWARRTALRTAERLEEPEVRDFEPRPPGGAGQQVVGAGLPANRSAR